MFSGQKSADKTEEQKQAGSSGDSGLEDLNLPPGVTFSPNIKDIPIFIDGIEHREDSKKIVVKRLKKDNVHVSVPIITYLPLKMDDLPNLHF